jgi:hypothetical protein
MRRPGADEDRARRVNPLCTRECKRQPR